MKRSHRVMVSSAVASITVLWSLWSPFSPDEVNAVLRSEPAVIPLAVGTWVLQFALVMFLIRWVDEQ